MAVAYRSSSSAATGASGGTSLSISAPTGVASGDVLLAVLAVDYQSASGTYTVTAPSGWSAVNAALTVTGPTSGNGQKTALWTFWKTAGSSESSSYSFTIADGHGTAANAAGSMAAFSGAQQSDTGTQTTTSTSGSSFAVGGVAGAVSTDMVVLLAGGQDNAAQSTGSMTLTGPTSPWTSVASAAASASHNKLPCVTALSYQAGVTTGGTFTYAGNAGCAWVQNLCSVAGSTTSGTTATFSPSANANAGDALILSVSTRTPTAGTTITVTDTKSNTWTVDVTGLSNNNFVAVASTRQNGGALTTSDTVTVTFSAAWSNSGVNLQCDEFYGLASASYTDGTASNNDGGTTGNTSAGAGSITPTQNGDLIVAAVNWAFSGSPTITPNTSGTVGTYTSTVILGNGTAPKSLAYGYQILSAGSGTAQQFDTTTDYADSVQAVSVAYKTVGSYNMAALAVAVNVSTTYIAAADTTSGADVAGGPIVGNGDTTTAADTASVTASVGGAGDTGSGAESGLSRVPVTAADASSAAADTATIVAMVPAADAGVYVEPFQVLANGATLAFGNDFSSGTSDGATAALSETLTDSLAGFDTASIAVQGPIPSGYQRIIRIQPEVDNVQSQQ